MFGITNDKSAEKNFIDSFVHPFKSDKIEEIEFKIEKNFWSNYKMRFSARVSFRNNNTNGTHSIQAEDFSSLLQKTEAFIKSL